MQQEMLFSSANQITFSIKPILQNVVVTSIVPVLIAKLAELSGPELKTRANLSKMLQPPIHPGINYVQST